MKKSWKSPTLEKLDVSMTMKGWKPEKPDKPGKPGHPEEPDPGELLDS